MLHRHILKVKVNTLHQEVCRDKHLTFLRELEYRTVITDAFQRLGVSGFYVFGEMTYESELTQLCYFQYFELFKHYELNNYL